MPMKKRLILHAGLPRTGTTTIQNFLHQNRSVLMEQGIWYPRFDSARYVHATGGTDSLRTKSILANLSTGEFHEILATAIGQAAKNAQRFGFTVDPSIWQDFLEDFANSAYHTAIISFEGFGSHPQGHNLEPFKDVLSNFHFEGIIYHRDYENWAISLFEQNIRGKVRYKQDFEKFIEGRNIATYPFAKRAELLMTNLLLNQLHVRSFEQASRNDALLEDFFHALGFHDLWAAIAPPKQPRRNASLLPSQSLVLQQLNRWNVSDDSFVEIRQAFTRLAMRTRFDDPYSLVSDVTRARLEALAAAEADSLRQLYGIVPVSKAGSGSRPRPHMLTRARFEEMIRSIADEIAPQLHDELLERSRELGS